MNPVVQQEIDAPVVTQGGVSANVERIRLFQKNGETYLSTSQRIMVGLALCRPDLLDLAGYPPDDIKAAWCRLDDAQRQAVTAWWKD